MSRYPVKTTITLAEYERLKRDRRAFILATSRSTDPTRNARDRAYYRKAATKGRRR